VQISADARRRAAIDALTAPGRLAIFDWETRVLGPRGSPAPSDPRVTGGVSAGAALAGVPRKEALRRSGGRGTVVRAEGGPPDHVYVLAGDPALTNADIRSVKPVRDDLSGEPTLALAFTSRGQRAFTRLTREVAHRGRRAQRSAASPAEAEANQHFVIVLDGRIISAPYVDFRQSPDGVDGAAGSQISGGLTAGGARRLAAILGSGPLPARLKRVS
jgi:preprotein translocase subunit SecD